MELSFVRLIKAGEPSPYNRRIYCNDEGVFIGPGCALIQAEIDYAGRKSYQLRPRSEIAQLLDAGYGFHLDLDGLIRSLDAVAKALDDGDATLAQIATLQLGLPELADDEAARRMASADRLVKANFNPNEPRDSYGRWTTAGSASADARTQLAQNTQSSAAARSVPPRLVHVAGFPDSLPPFTKPQIRGKDGYGKGNFNADRDYGKRRHLGVDLIAAPGTVVTSPVSGDVARFDPYRAGDWRHGKFSAVQITTDDGYTVRLMYIHTSGLEDGQRVEAGDSLGTVQNLSDVYPLKDPNDDRSGMTNHVHFDIKRGGTYLDPTPLVTAWQQLP